MDCTLDAMVFAADGNAIDAVYVAGKQVVLVFSMDALRRYSFGLKRTVEESAVIERRMLKRHSAPISECIYLPDAHQLLVFCKYDAAHSVFIF